MWVAPNFGHSFRATHCTSQHSDIDRHALSRLSGGNELWSLQLRMNVPDVQSLSAGCKHAMQAWELVVSDATLLHVALVEHAALLEELLGVGQALLTLLHLRQRMSRLRQVTDKATRDLIHVYLDENGHSMTTLGLH